MTLQQQVLADRLASYARLRGGYSVPVAGAVYWAALGAAGYLLPERQWILTAFYTSGLIFPFALLVSKIFRNDFIKDKTATGTVLFPAFVGMLMFWPIAFAAAGTAPALVSLILAIGMSMHWPVIGWSYGRPVIYGAHAVVRAVVALAIWALYPDQRQTWLPLAVAAIYVVTIAAILVDSAVVRRRLETTLSVAVTLYRVAARRYEIPSTRGAPRAHDQTVRFSAT